MTLRCPDSEAIARSMRTVPSASGSVVSTASSSALSALRQSPFDSAMNVSYASSSSAIRRVPNPLTGSDSA